MKQKLHLFIFSFILIIASACNDGDISPVNNNTSPVSSASKCQITTVENIYEGEGSSFANYTYDTKGNITKFEFDEIIYTVSYDKNNVVSQFKDSSEELIVDYINDAKGSLSEIKWTVKDENTNKSFTFSNKYTLNANGNVTKIAYKYDFYLTLFALAFGGEIKEADFPEIPITFTYDGKQNISSIIAETEGKKIPLLSGLEHDTNINPISLNPSLYRIYLFFGFLGLSDGEIVDLGFLSKNNITKANFIDSEGNAIKIDYSYEINDKKLPSKSTVKYLYDGVLETLSNKYTYKCN